nr:hypothetical protein [Mesorhizobium sp.]
MFSFRIRPERQDRERAEAVNGALNAQYHEYLYLYSRHTNRPLLAENEGNSDRCDRGKTKKGWKTYDTGHAHRCVEKAVYLFRLSLDARHGWQGDGHERREQRFHQEIESRRASAYIPTT